MEKNEVKRIEDYLRKKFDLPSIAVSPRPEMSDFCAVNIGENFIGNLSRIEEEGEIEYQFEMKIGAEIGAATPKDTEAYLRSVFGLNSISVTRRPNKDDSTEVNIGDEFIGILFKDVERGEVSYAFQMAILDFDLDED